MIVIGNFNQSCQTEMFNQVLEKVEYMNLLLKKIKFRSDQQHNRSINYS